ncbi:hypothetical protein HUT18_31770 [Streptomyces sp. NA04227]|uniref:hypothetical protein n=1 Tax=Streptomyces sp. NA04227 TaxID=2742136 RepID=UPI001590E41C|nr:hypothetical protein [Streptomyces sp. NA04227]QKW10308.1 hypothetical protein HUT18_31770 [Streptomyces sp. NA04227]
MDIVATSTGLYSRASESFLRMGEATRGGEEVPHKVEIMADRWIRRSPEAHETVLKTCPLKAERTRLESDYVPAQGDLEGPHVREAAVFQGKPTVKITYRVGRDTVVLHIAAKGKPYLLNVVNTANGEDTTFRDVGKRLQVMTPPGAVHELDIAREVMEAQ